MIADTDGRARIAVVATAVCVCCLALAVWGIFDLRSGNASILAAVSRPSAQSVRTIAIDYTDTEGAPHHITVTAEPGEAPERLVARLRADLAASEIIFPRRR